MNGQRAYKKMLNKINHHGNETQKNDNETPFHYLPRKIKIKDCWPGAVAHACSPALWEAEAGRSPEVRSLIPAWPT